MQKTSTTTGTLARMLGISREQILADLELLQIEPPRDSIGRRLLTAAHVKRIVQLHERRQRRRVQGGSGILARPAKIAPGAS